MKSFSIRAGAVGIALALTAFAGSALAKPHTIRAGNLYLKDDGGISPSRLPRHEQAPISAHIDAEIGTTDGSHPPAVQTLNIDFDKTLGIDARGLPACKKGRLEARTTAAAKQACSSSIVGSGAGKVEVAFPESQPFTARGPVVLFNGGVHGGTTLLFAHAYVSVPAPTAVVVPVEISRIHRGHYGIHSVTKVPAIAGGSGSVTDFEISIDRRFAYRGKQRSYLTASCPTGRYYTEGEIFFSGGAELKGVHILPCTPLG
jgi:hypothetical protein